MVEIIYRTNVVRISNSGNYDQNPIYELYNNEFSNIAVTIEIEVFEKNRHH